MKKRKNPNGILNEIIEIKADIKYLRNKVKSIPKLWESVERLKIDMATLKRIIGWILIPLLIAVLIRLFL